MKTKSPLTELYKTGNRLIAVLNSTHKYYKYSVMNIDALEVIVLFQRCCEVWAAWLRFCYILSKVFGPIHPISTNVVTFAQILNKLYLLALNGQIDMVLEKLRYEMASISSNLMDNTKNIVRKINDDGRELEYDSINLTILKELLPDMKIIQKVKRVVDNHYQEYEVPVVNVMAEYDAQKIGPLYADNDKIENMKMDTVSSVAGARLVRCYNALIDMCNDTGLAKISGTIKYTQMALDHNCRIINNLLVNKEPQNDRDPTGNAGTRSLSCQSATA